MKKILITGANGFIGKNLIEALSTTDYKINAAIRQSANAKFINRKAPVIMPIEKIDQATNWDSALDGVDIVIHTAARVHQMQDRSEDPMIEYRNVNRDGTLHLLSEANKMGIKHFVFLSSIKVNGESTTATPFIEEQMVNPDDPYGLSKWEAEQGIIEFCQTHSIQYTIIRLPLVYGCGVKANFANLLDKVKRRYFLPLGNIGNQRSFLYIGNLTAAIQKIIENPNAKNQTYLLSDNDDLSTASLVKKIAQAYGVKPRLLNIPISLLTLLGKLTGKSKAISRLTSSLQIDSSKIRQQLDWQPPYTVVSGLQEMIEQERQQASK